MPAQSKIEQTYSLYSVIAIDILNCRLNAALCWALALEESEANRRGGVCEEQSMEQDTVVFRSRKGQGHHSLYACAHTALYFVVRGLVFIHQDYEGRKGGKSFTSCN